MKFRVRDCGKHDCFMLGKDIFVSLVRTGINRVKARKFGSNKMYIFHKDDLVDKIIRDEDWVSTAPIGRMY